ncbi:hypothetical protein [Xanthomonas sacchari]|uniref:Protein sip-5 n=1 Tax=Xanthomonas sacchari TaxID=56458 RepID=A0A2P5Z1S4_9XANT|nr:hypothetical protein [Xanthomonas sacchari]MDV0439266.1 hypothetical protein [Xanthomonas sacchari]PPU81442.1 hypothetical protein XsacCFBP4641_14535 [Xanthomonas sacchari]
MSLRQLQHRIARAEAVLEGRQEQVRTHWATLQQVWREGWTPWRIVVVGLGTGFLVGRAEPAAVVGKLGGARWLQMLSAVSSLINATTAKSASDNAERASDDAEEAADTAQDAAVDAATQTPPPATPVPPSPARPQSVRPPTGSCPGHPAAAEAATDLSER